MLKGIDISYCQAGLSIPDLGDEYGIVQYIVNNMLK